MKVKPMTAGEFSRYMDSIPPFQRDKFDAMLAFVTQVATERCALLIEENISKGDDLNMTQLTFNRIWMDMAKKMRDSANSSWRRA